MISESLKNFFFKWIFNLTYNQRGMTDFNQLVIDTSDPRKCVVFVDFLFQIWIKRPKWSFTIVSSSGLLYVPVVGDLPGNYVRITVPQNPWKLMEICIFNEPSRARGQTKERQIWMALRTIIFIFLLPTLFGSIASRQHSSFELAQQ